MVYFISGKKCNDAGDPDFIASIYPRTASKKPRSTGGANVENLARFKHATRKSWAKEVVEPKVT